MSIREAIEFVALLHFDAKIDQKSRFETDMFATVLDQLKHPEISPRTLALCWLYCHAHATNPLGQFIKVSLSFVNSNGFKSWILARPGCWEPLGFWSVSFQRCSYSFATKRHQREKWKWFGTEETYFNSIWKRIGYEDMGNEFLWFGELQKRIFWN